MADSSHQTPDRIAQLLDRVRGRIKRYVWIEGLCIAIAWLCATFWIAYLIDYLPVLAGANELSAGIRFVLLAAIAIVLGLILYRWVFRRISVRFSDRSIALLLEKHFEQFGDTLITTVDTTGSNETGDLHSEMMVHATEDALSHVEDVAVEQVFNQKALLYKMAGAAALLLSVIAFSLASPADAKTLAKRIYLLQDEKWPRQSLIEIVGVEIIRESTPAETFGLSNIKVFENGRVVVGQGADIRLIVRADANKVVPKTCTVYYELADGTRGQRNMRKEGQLGGDYQTFAFSDKPLRGILESIEFEVVGNDHRIGTYQIDVVNPPTLSEIALNYSYPKYTGMDDRVDEAWLKGMSLASGSDVTFNLTANKPLDRAFIENTDLGMQTDMYFTTVQAVDETKIPVVLIVQRLIIDEAGALDLQLPGPVTLRHEKSGNEIQWQKTSNGVQYKDEDWANADGRIAVALDDDRLASCHVVESQDEFHYMIKGMQRDINLQISLLDRDGIITENPHVVTVAATNDLPPSIDVALDGIGTAITPDVNIPVIGEVTDDYGISDTWFQVQLTERDPYTFPIELTQGTEVDSNLDFRAERANLEELELKPGEKLILSVQSVDQYDLAGDPNLGESSQFTLDIVTPDQLLAVLERRELGLRQRFELILGEVQLMKASLATVSNQLAGVAPVISDDPEDQAEELSEEEQQERNSSLRLLRVQRALVQSEKSNAESMGIAVAFEDIRAEIINNRVDTEDRKIRLQDQIIAPLYAICETDFIELDRLLKELEKSFISGQESTDLAVQVDAQAETVLLKLDEVLQRMLELETYNELIELVRDLIGEQDDLLEKTKEERKQQVLDLLK